MTSSTSPLPLPVPDLSGKVFLVTGGNAGIGLETVFQLAHQYAKVYIGCRSESKGQDAITNIKERVADADLHILLMDLMDLSSIVRAAKELIQKETRLDGLINNAGIMATPFAISSDGYEAQLQTNYIAHWLLTHLLTPLLLSTCATSTSTPTPAPTSTPAQSNIRIINVTSQGHAYAPAGGIAFDDINQVRSGGPWTRYGQSKLAQILHARELLRLYGAQGLQTAAVHPGNVDTGLSRNAANVGRWSSTMAPVLRCVGVLITAPQAAATPVFAATSEKLVPGSYLVPIAKVGKGSKEARDEELGKRLWAWTEGEMRGKGFLE